MSTFRFSAGNLVSRAPAAPVAATPSAADSTFGVADLGNGYPDEPARWAWNASGTYRVNLDLNLLEVASSRTEAPTGWGDFGLERDGTPGLGPFPPGWGMFGGSDLALRIYRPVFQDFQVMPGETIRVQVGLYLPAASSATQAWATLIDLETGEQYDAAGEAWNTSLAGLGGQAATDAWLDLDVEVPATDGRTRRAAYRLILGLDAAAYDGTAYAYYRGREDHEPSAVGPFSVAAIVGHDLPVDSAVTITENGGEGGVAVSLTPAQPSFFGYTFGEAELLHRFYQVQIQTAAGMLGVQGRPFVGELWMGAIQDFAWCPAFPFVIEDEDLAQVRLPAGGHSTAPRTRRGFTVAHHADQIIRMKFKANDDGYRQVRDVLQDATRHGVDPLLVLPNSALEGDACFHGRVDKKVTYTRDNLMRRSFDVILTCSPFPVVRS